MSHIFNELDFRNFVVQRWGVVSTIRKQSIAEHGWSVAVLADRIAREWFGITDERLLYQIVRRAIFHDWRESITGDFPSYMKRHVDTTLLEAEFGDMIDAVNTDIFVGEKWGDLVRAIVKIADYIDAAIFLRMELSHGNKSVLYILRDLEQRFKVYCESLTIGDIKAMNGIYDMYLAQVIDPLFGTSGQYYSEGFRF